MELINRTPEEVMLSCENKHIVNKWEYLKYRVREVSQEYSRNCMSEMNLIISQLSEKIQEMEGKISVTDLELFGKTKLDLNDFTNKKAQANIFRSKVQFYEFGEKPTGYFLGMERARFNTRTCNSLFNDKDELVNDTKGILKLQENFYSNLYTTDPNIKFNLENVFDKNMSAEIHEQQTQQLTQQEIAAAIKQLPNKKMCGNDGIPVDFYKVF